MAGVDRTVFADALKEYYMGPMIENINRATALLSVVQTRKNAKVEGKQFIIPLITRKHRGIVSRSGASRLANKLPTASQQSYKRLSYFMKYHYARIMIDGPVMRSAKTDKGSFARALDAEIRGVTVALPQDFNRQIWGDGLNKLCQPSANVASSTTVNVDDTRFLEVGMLLTVLANASGAVVVATAEVASIVSATQFTTTAAISLTAATDGIYTESDATATSWNNGMTGLKAIISNANVSGAAVNVGSIDRSAAANDFWKANVKSNSDVNRPLSVGLMQQALLAGQLNRAGGQAPTHCFMDSDMWSTYGNLIHNDRRFDQREDTLEAGWSYLKFSGIKLMWDKDAPANSMWWFNINFLFFLSQTEMQFMEEDGNMLHRVADYDAYEATLVCDKELAADMCACHTLLDDIEVNLG